MRCMGLPQPLGLVSMRLPLSQRHGSLTFDEPLDRIDVHCAQRPKMLSSLFYVDIQPHHDVKVQHQLNSRQNVLQ